MTCELAYPPKSLPGKRLELKHRIQMSLFQFAPLSPPGKNSSGQRSLPAHVLAWTPALPPASTLVISHSYFQPPYIPETLGFYLCPLLSISNSSVLPGSHHCSPNIRLHQQTYPPMYPKGGLGNVGLPVGVRKHRKAS